MTKINEILNQLTGSNNGYGRLSAMAGAHTFVKHSENSVSFKFKGSKTANYCKITLDWMDLYTIELGKIKGMSFASQEKTGFYADMLKPHFEKETGLRLSL